MAEQKEPRGDAGWAELAWAGQPLCLTAGPQADLEWTTGWLHQALLLAQVSTASLWAESI